MKIKQLSVEIYECEKKVTKYFDVGLTLLNKVDQLADGERQEKKKKMFF